MDCSAATPVWFLAVYLTMSAVRPEYSHLTKAISELGSWDAPKSLGVERSGLYPAGPRGEPLRRGPFCELSPKARISSAALVLSGLLMALSGAFPGDFENRQSPSMLMHLVGSLGSYIAFLVAGFGLPRVMRASPAWEVGRLAFAGTRAAVHRNRLSAQWRCPGPGATPDLCLLLPLGRADWGRHAASRSSAGACHRNSEVTPRMSQAAAVPCLRGARPRKRRDQPTDGEGRQLDWLGRAANGVGRAPNGVNRQVIGVGRRVIGMG